MNIKVLVSKKKKTIINSINCLLLIIPIKINLYLFLKLIFHKLIYWNNLLMNKIRFYKNNSKLLNKMKVIKFFNNHNNSKINNMNWNLWIMKKIKFIIKFFFKNFFKVIKL